MNVLYSPSAHANTTVPSKGFYFATDVNAPADAFLVSDADHMTAVNLPHGSSYSFTAPTSPFTEVEGEQVAVYAVLTTTAPSEDVLIKQAQENQTALITAAYLAAINEPVEYMGTTFNADQTSLTTLNNAVAAAMGNAPPGFAWYDTKDNAVPMTFSQLQGLASAIFLRTQPLFVHKQTQKAAIFRASSIAAVQAINW